MPPFYCKSMDCLDELIQIFFHNQMFSHFILMIISLSFQKKLKIKFSLTLHPCVHKSWGNSWANLPIHTAVQVEVYRITSEAECLTHICEFSIRNMRTNRITVNDWATDMQMTSKLIDTHLIGRITLIAGLCCKLSCDAKQRKKSKSSRDH